MGKQIKYLGTAHIRLLEKGESWNKRLKDGLSKDVSWSIDNHFLVDTEEAGLSDDAVELLLEDPEFKDVTDLQRIPVSAAENLWHGIRDKSFDRTDPRVDADGVFHSTLVDGGSDDVTATGASATGTGTTTTGGSTTGDAGAGSRSGRSGRGAPGGSTSGD